MGGPVPVPPGNVGRPDPGDTVLAGQRALARLGYSVKVDGMMGSGTRQAIYLHAVAEPRKRALACKNGVTGVRPAHVAGRHWHGPAHADHVRNRIARGRAVHGRCGCSLLDAGGRVWLRPRRLAAIAGHVRDRAKRTTDFVRRAGRIRFGAAAGGAKACGLGPVAGCSASCVPGRAGGRSRSVSASGASWSTASRVLKRGAGWRLLCSASASPQAMAPPQPVRNSAEISPRMPEHESSCPFGHARPALRLRDAPLRRPGRTLRRPTAGRSRSSSGLIDKRREQGIVPF